MSVHMAGPMMQTRNLGDLDEHLDPGFALHADNLL